MKQGIGVLSLCIVLLAATGVANAYWAEDFDWKPPSDFVDVRYADDQVFMLGTVKNDPRYMVLVSVFMDGSFNWSRWIGPMPRGACCLEVVGGVAGRSKYVDAFAEYY